MKNTIDFSNDKIPYLLKKMSVPAIISMLVNGLYYLADAAFVGWGVGKSALAGLSLIFPVQMFMIAWGSMIGMGTASVISRKLGEKDREGAYTASKSSLISAAVSGIIFTALTMLFMEQLLLFLGSTENTSGAASGYLETLQYGFIFIFLSMAGFNISRAQGLAGEAGKGMLIGTAVNLILDPVFIFIFNMGVQGAALATVIARILSTAYYFIVLNRRNIILRLSFFRGKAALNTVKNIFSLGAGNFFGQICFSVTAVIINNALRKYGTETDTAVYGILSRIHVFITMPLLGLAQGFQPVAGFNYGAGRYKRFLQTAGTASIAAILMGTAMLILPLTAPGFVISLFTNESGLVTAGREPLRISLLMLPFIGLQILGFSFFQAAGEPGKTLIISVSRHLIFLLPLLLIMPPLFGTAGLWISFPAADILSASLSILLMGKFRSRIIEKTDCLKLHAGKDSD